MRMRCNILPQWDVLILKNDKKNIGLNKLWISLFPTVLMF